MHKDPQRLVSWKNITYFVCQNAEGQRFTNTSLFWAKVQPSIRNTGKHSQMLWGFFKYLNSWKYSHLQSRGHNSLVLTVLKREVLTSCLGKYSFQVLLCSPYPLTWAQADRSSQEAARISHLLVNSSCRPQLPGSGHISHLGNSRPHHRPLTQKVWNHSFRIYQVPTIAKVFCIPVPGRGVASMQKELWFCHCSQVA